MSEQQGQGAAGIEELSARLARHERAWAFVRDIDERLEQGLKKREPVEALVPQLLIRLKDELSASFVAVHTLDESLAERLFTLGDEPEQLAPWGAERPEPSETGASSGDYNEASIERRGEEGSVQLRIWHPLDVAGESLGEAFACVADPGDTAEPCRLLHLFCESLDNHLAAIAASRQRFEVIREVSDALKEPVLGLGLNRAIEILGRELRFDDLVLVYRHEDPQGARGVYGYKIYRDGLLLHDSDQPTDTAVDALMADNARALLAGDDASLRTEFGMTRYREEVLITGVRTARVVGRLWITSGRGEFHTHDRELLDRFADYLRQRIVDYNREWKHLAKIFSSDVCERLLKQEDYRERWLTPREKEVVVLFTDLAGFTRVSEEVFRKPEAIGRLIDTWAGRAVDILWSHGASFDKMIGDCVIGHFGPPFYDEPPAEQCRRALIVAREIREMTQALGTDPRLPELASSGLTLDVATGINFCPLSVGFFGPSDDFTGFSSGMNNAARLQGIAGGAQILCMEQFVTALGTDEEFGPKASFEAKNVAKPLDYREWKG